MVNGDLFPMESTMTSRAPVYIGTSGWHYDHWRGPFYPKDMTPDQFLAHYQRFFRSVEINNSFYQLPKKKTFETWKDSVPEGFIFSVKASRFITHMKKLKDTREAVNLFLERVTALGDKLGPLLFQLPPRWRCSPDRLREFLDSLPHRFIYSFEFRDPSWFNEEVLGILQRHNAAFCIYDLNGRLSPLSVTASFVYVRLHGPGGPYQGCYTMEALARWARLIDRWRDEGRAVYIYFDNDEAGYAAQNALSLKNMVMGERVKLQG
jgi:uncharacterized protein YecE (DUF72 family)